MNSKIRRKMLLICFIMAFTAGCGDKNSSNNIEEINSTLQNDVEVNVTSTEMETNTILIESERDIESAETKEQEESLVLLEDLFSDKFDAEFVITSPEMVFGNGNYISKLLLHSTRFNTTTINFLYDGYTFPVTAHVQFVGIPFDVSFMNNQPDNYLNYVKKTFPELNPKVDIYVLDCGDEQKEKLIGMLGNFIEDFEKELESSNILYQSQELLMDGVIHETVFNLEEPKYKYVFIMVGNIHCKGIMALEVDK